MDDLSRLMPKPPTRGAYTERNLPGDFEFYKARSHREREVNRCTVLLCFPFVVLSSTPISSFACFFVLPA